MFSRIPDSIILFFLTEPERKKVSFNKFDEVQLTLFFHKISFLFAFSKNFLPITKSESLSPMFYSKSFRIFAFLYLNI